MTSILRTFPSLMIGVLLIVPVCAADHHPSSSSYLSFSGDNQYVEIASARDLSPGRDGFTVSAWLKPDTLEFSHSEGSGYVYWMGKGERGQQEWAARMYSYTNRERPPRPNRISFYLFNPDGGLGEGSYVQNPVTAGQWIQMASVAHGGETAIYYNGEYIRCDEYDGPTGGHCQAHNERIRPTPGEAPLRIGTRDLHSFFEGGLSQVRIWSRALDASEIRRLYENDQISRRGLEAEFLLDEGHGTVVHDTAGKHTGHVIGARWVELH